MTEKSVIPRKRAQQDIEEAIAHYLQEASDQVAFRFIDALEHAYIHISRHPATGSPRYAHELNIAELRTWPLPRFPFLIFYITRPDHIDVLRVLHVQRDIPTWQQADDANEETSH